jgi:methylamine---glutamate N-methyltransferase subunit A
MCGIVGLHLKDPTLEPRLGEMLVPMLSALATRGPDSAGIALYGDELPAGTLRWSLRAPDPGYAWEALAEKLAEELGAAATVRRNADVGILTAAGAAGRVREHLHALAPELAVVGFGSAMEIYKDVGDPGAICERYGLRAATGYQGVGHTRMATESLGDALRMVLKEFDGFFTLLVGTRTQFAVVRDAFACKPAVIAECASYVAMASEYHALAGLPDIEAAEVFEPMPEEIHLWSR